MAAFLNELSRDKAYIQSQSGAGNDDLTVNAVIKIKESGTYVLAVGHRIEDGFNRFAFGIRTFTGEAGDQVPVSVWIKGYSRKGYNLALFQSADLIQKRITFFSFLRNLF